MRKLIAIVLVFVMVLSMFGCKKADNTDKNTLNLQEMLLFQAIQLAQQIGMSAEGQNMDALSISLQMISLASGFRQAGSGYPAEAQIFTANGKVTPTTVTQMCGQICTAAQIGTGSALTISTAFALPNGLTEPASVYLRYNDRCQFLVIFTPLENGLVSAWAYPLFSNAVKNVLGLYTAKADIWSGPQIEESCKAAAKCNYNATCTEATPNADHYKQLATSLFAGYKKISAKHINSMTSQQNIILQALAVNDALAAGIQDAAAYNYPAQMQTDVDTVLGKLSKPALAETVTQRFYLSAPNQWVAAHGEEWLTTSSILRALMNTKPMGATAVKGEEPVFVLLGLNGNYCIVVSIYPNEHQVYTYQFAFLPLTFADAQVQLEADGAVRMQ